MSNVYMQHLLFSMEKNMETVRQQMGKTDIEPPDYEDEVIKWHNELLDKISEKEPEYYVRSVNVYENGLFDIKYIEYIYFDSGKKVYPTSVNLFDVDDNACES